MVAYRVILTLLILMQAFAGGFAPSSRVICIGPGGHIAIEKPHLAGACAAERSPSCCGSCDEHSEHEPHSDDCNDVDLVDVDLKRDTTRAADQLNEGPPFTAVLIAIAAPRIRAAAHDLQVARPPDLATRRMLRATVLLI